MKLTNLIKVAFRSIFKNRLRSFLTMLGIIIGVGSVIAMISIGEGAQSSIESQISSLGTNMLMVMPGRGFSGRVSSGAGGRASLTMKDVELMRQETALLRYVSPLINSRNQVIAGRYNWFTSIQGVDPEFLEIRDWQIAEGAMFNNDDVRVKRRVAILGKTVVDELFPDGSPVGQSIRVRNVPFTVIGVLASKGQSATGSDSDDVILAPSATVLFKLGDGQNVSTIFASGYSPETLAEASQRITELLRASHRLNADEDDDFFVRTQTEVNQMATQVTSTLTYMLTAIAGVSLLVGGIGIMNIMLVSVTERTSEIGLRLAVGARSGDILIQFLIEAVMLCLLGGVIGIVTGFAIGAGIGRMINVGIAINPLIVFLSVAFSALVGIFFGFYPARRAANLNPIDALRYE